MAGAPGRPDRPGPRLHRRPAGGSTRPMTTAPICSPSPATWASRVWSPKIALPARDPVPLVAQVQTPAAGLDVFGWQPLGDRATPQTRIAVTAVYAVSGDMPDLRARRPFRPGTG